MMKSKNLKKLINIVLVLFFVVSGVTGSIAISRENADTVPFVSETDIFDSGNGELIKDMAGSVSSSLGAIDYDNDGDLDLIEGADNYINILTNKQGEFIRQSFYMLPNKNGYGDDLDRVPFPVGDFNNDGKQDFLVGGIQGIIRLFVNNNSQPGTPNFTNYTIAEFGQCVRGIAVADFNDDGWMDFAASYSTRPFNYSTISIFYNTKNLEFTREDVYTFSYGYIDSLSAGDFLILLFDCINENTCY